MSERLEEQIVELQTKLQYQEDALNKLDDVVIRQGDIIDRLTWKFKELEEKLEESKHERSSQQDVADEKPPHY